MALRQRTPPWCFSASTGHGCGSSHSRFGPRADVLAELLAPEPVDALRLKDGEGPPDWFPFTPTTNRWCQKVDLYSLEIEGVADPF